MSRSTVQIGSVAPKNRTLNRKIFRAVLFLALLQANYSLVLSFHTEAIYKSLLPLYRIRKQFYFALNVLSLLQSSKTIKTMG